MPAVGGAVVAAPTEVALNFSEKLESVFSTVIVRDAVGIRVDKGYVQVDKADRTVMRVSLESLAQGIYIVEWRAWSADTHRTEGAFIFRVGQYPISRTSNGNRPERSVDLRAGHSL